MRYCRLMLGRQSAYAELCRDGNFIGADFDIHQDLTNDLPDTWREFNKKFIPVMQHDDPSVTNQSAGLRCGMLWTVCRGLEVGDIVLCPNGSGAYMVGRIMGSYYYFAGGELPHRRPVEWLPVLIARSAMSEPLQRSSGAIGTVAYIDKHATELAALIGPEPGIQVTTSDPTVEDAAVFAMEKYLQEFLVSNWSSTAFGAEYRIFEVDGAPVGDQFETDTGPLDILAESKDGKTLLVIELKKGRADDKVVGQVQRYMGFVQEVVAQPGQVVRGAIVALDDSLGVRRALSVTNNIDFFRYEVKFSLNKA